MPPPATMPAVARYFWMTLRVTVDVISKVKFCGFRHLSYFADKCLKRKYMADTRINIRQKLDREISTVIKRSKIDKRFISSKSEVSYSDFLSDKMLMMLIIRRGVPYSLFNLIQHFTPFSENDWASILDISTKSLQRYKLSSKDFKPIQSEKIIEMAEVTNIGLDVFGEMNKFKLWLNTPNFSLGNLMPLELLNDSYGKEMVIGELTRINHGILA
jgi:putative toxin-antitoxin system antitoxin component (TIGR02293 family)